MTARILVTGSREFKSLDLALKALSDARWQHGPDLTVVHGGTRGADRMLAALAQQRGLAVEEHRADWTANGKAAGFIRNQAMVDAGADLCLVFLVAGVACRGTKDCWRRADRAGIPCRVYESGGAS